MSKECWIEKVAFDIDAPDWDGYAFIWTKSPGDIPGKTSENYNPNEYVHLIEKSKYDKALEALREAAKPTYGTELCNTDAENYEIICDTLFALQGKIRKIIKELEETND